MKNNNNNNSKLNNVSPWFITGLVDAEGSFIISVFKNLNKKLGFGITYTFEIGLNIRDRVILELLQKYWGVGEIYNHPSDNTCRYRVSNLKDLLNVIIPHFLKYPGPPWFARKRKGKPTGVSNTKICRFLNFL